MFTGLIQSIGTILEIIPNTEGQEIVIQTELSSKIKIDDSIATNGVCLTATAVDDKSFRCQAVPMTLQKSNLGDLKVGGQVNLELSLRADDRLGGHMVQGHVNGVGKITEIKEMGKTWEFTVTFPPDLRKYMILEGSIAIDGISLTIAVLNETSLTLAIIPHTLEKTTLGVKKLGDRVNIEVDMVAKYIENFLTRSDTRASEWAKNFGP